MRYEDRSNRLLQKAVRNCLKTEVVGTVTFYHARWEDMPTQYMIVNTFHGLEIKEYRGASVAKSVGGKDLSDQRILR